MLSNKYIMAIVGCLLVSTCAHAMENKSLQLIKIKDSKAVTPLSGKIVAYTATSSSLEDNNNKYYLPLSRLSYGYVTINREAWESGCGHNLHQLLNKGSFPRTAPLTDEQINNANLHMREVTFREAHNILRALTSEQASFSYMLDGQKNELIAELQLMVQKHNQ